MKKLILVCTLIMTIAFSCDSVKVDQKNAFIQLTKKRCLGKCPVYDLFIYKNGIINYNGIDHVTKKGKHQFKISKEELAKIELLFTEADFMSLESGIPKKIRDLPKTVIIFKGKKMSFEGQRIPKKIKKIIIALENLI